MVHPYNILQNVQMIQSSLGYQRGWEVNIVLMQDRGTVVHPMQMQAVRDGKEYICWIHIHVLEVKIEQSSCSWGYYFIK